MAINPNIALSFRRPQLRSPLETYGRAQQIAANAMTAEKLRNEAASVNALRDYIGSGGKLDTAEGLQGAVAAGVAPDTARAYSERLGNVSKSQADAKIAAEQKLYARLPSIYAAADDAAWMRFVNDLAVIDKPDADELLRLTGGKFNSRIIRAMMAGSKEYFNKLVSTPVASFQVSDQGVPQSVTAGGEEPSVKEIPQFRYEEDQPTSTAGISRPPPLPSDFDRAFSEGIPAGEEAIDAAAQAIARGAGVSDPALKNLSGRDFEEANRRAGRIMLEKPISFNQSGVEPLTMETAPQIIQTAVQNGVIDQSHVEQLRQMVGPENDQALANWMRQNNVRIQPTGAPSMRTAVYRQPAVDYFTPQTDDGGMPFGGPAAALRQNIGYTPTTTRFKSPMQSPLPGSAQVPIPRVRAEAQAQRETPEEASARTTATERAKIAVEREKSLPAKRQVSTIVKKIRDAYETLNKAEAIPSSKRGAAANVWDYLAVSTPGREIQRAFGTETSKSLTDITASRKLLATAIKNATGMSAQEMNSNVELQLMLDALTDPTQGYEGAISVLDTIEDLYGAKNGSPASNAKAGKKIVRTGVANGRRVVQYSDGSVEYAN